MYLMFLFLPFFSFIICSSLGQLFGSRGCAFLASFFLGISAFLSFFIFYEIILCDSNCIISLDIWINCGLLNIYWNFYFDNLSAVMGVMITLVSFCVHVFSINYMEKDFQHERFMSLLSLFTFFMYILVFSDNMLQLLLGWEGVGICSYLLINFWYMRKNTNDSALKAIFYNRVGDLFLLWAIFIVFGEIKSLDYSIIFDNFDLFINSTFNLFIYQFEINTLFIICFCLFIAAMAKSAQIFLQGWLGDAMEGPTPVSALIHAATMVTAGIYLLCRFSIFFTNCNLILHFIVISGLLTVFICSVIGIDSSDLKKIIASSTASQLGYMFYTCGLTQYGSAICHLFYHAFFKALLFLSAGVIIHSLSNEQDIRKMGGLLKKMPLVFVAMSFGSYGLIGLPYIGGFYSKDPLIEYSDLLVYVDELMTLFAATLGAHNTAFYSIRLLSLVFLGNFKGEKIILSYFHNSSWFLQAPLIILMFLTFSSFLFFDLFLGEGQNTLSFFNEDIFLFREGELDLDTFIITIFFIFLGILNFDKFLFSISNLFLVNKNLEILEFFRSFNFLKWFFDLFFIKLIVNCFNNASNFLFKFTDRGVLETSLGPTLVVRKFKILVYFFSSLQTGFIYHYILLQIISIILLFLSYFFNFNILVWCLALHLCFLIFLLTG